MSILQEIDWDSRPSNCPKSHFYMLMTGHLMAAEESEINPSHPVMMCGVCGEHPIDLIWRHEPLPPDYFRKSHKESEVIAGSTWGEDVTAICPCCSFSHCSHKSLSTRRAE